MEVWAVMQLLLLLMGAVQGQTDELSSEEERKALMLKHLQEVLELSEMSEEETAQEVSLKETEEPDAKEVLEEDPEEEEEEKPEEELPRSTLMTPTTVSPTQDEEDGFTYVFSRLNSLDAAVHRLNVQFYHMDLRVSQFSQGLAKLKGDLSEAQESLASLNEIATRNQKELGRIDGCLRGRRTQTKCFLVFKHFEGYDGAQKLCEVRGGQLAMPADATEMAVLRRYLHDAFHPYNWPAWVGIHDRRSEGLWLFENGHRVSVFDWYRDHLVTQPNGGARENCVSLSSDDGKWWDNDCERRMYYVCEYRL